MTDLLVSPAVSLVNGRPCVSSLKIAEHFGKNHDRVLKDIRRISGECPDEFTAVNFDVSEYTDSTGRTLPMYNVFQDGFVLLVMGYTGKQALQIKLMYIAAFNAMRAALQKKAEKVALKEAKKKALPPAPGPSYAEKCAEVTARMLALRGEVFRASKDMMCIFRDPFWGPAGHIPEEKKPFANPMNYAVQSFMMAVNKDLEAAELLFNAYVEGEKILHG